MSKFVKILTTSAALLAAGLLSIGMAAPAMARPALPPATTSGGVTTQTASASDAFPLLKGFLNMPLAERNQIALGYVVKIKHADPSQVHITLDGAPLSVSNSGWISPLPTRAQLNNGAHVVISGPAEAAVAMRLRVYSTQPRGTDYDATGLANGVRQANRAAGQIAGLLAMTMPKLDRVYFVGGGAAMAIAANGQQQALPRTGSNGEYPAGTPYFIPGQMGNAVKIHLNAAPSQVLFDNPPK